MLGPFLLPFIDITPPVTNQDEGADNSHKKRRYVYATPVLHRVYFRSKAFEFSYSFSSFRLKEYQKDCRALFSSKAHCFSDSYSSVYVKNSFAGATISDASTSLSGFYYRNDFAGLNTEEVFKDTSKADFVLSTYDNRYEMEDAAILFHISLNF